MVVEPADKLVTSPSNPNTLSTVATTSSEDSHVNNDVTSWVVASVNVPVAVN